MRRRAVLGVAAVALGAPLTVDGTLARFTDAETATNVITTGLIDINLIEAVPVAPVGGSVEENENGGYSYAGITPGSTLEKKPKIILIDNPNDAWARIQVEVIAGAVDIDLTEMVYMKDRTVVEPELVGGRLHFYCPNVLSPDGTPTYVPFNEVSSPSTDSDGELTNARVDIVLTVEVTQLDDLDAETARVVFAGQDIRLLETETAETSEASSRA